MTNRGNYNQNLKMKTDACIPFSIVSENQNNDRYTDPSSVCVR